MVKNNVVIYSRVWEYTNCEAEMLKTKIGGFTIVLWRPTIAGGFGRVETAKNMTVVHSETVWLNSGEANEREVLDMLAFLDFMAQKL